MCLTPREMASVHTHRDPHALTANSGRGARAPGRKPVRGLEGQGCSLSFTSLHRQPTGTPNPSGKATALIWAPSTVLSITGHTSHMQGAGGDTAGETLNLPWPESAGRQGGLLSPQDPSCSHVLDDPPSNPSQGSGRCPCSWTNF